MAEEMMETGDVPLETLPTPSDSEPEDALLGQDNKDDEDAESCATEDLSSRPISPPPSTPPLVAPQRLGLNIVAGDANGFDVITVHGIRDDHSTAWRTKQGTLLVSQRLLHNWTIREIAYSYDTGEGASVFDFDGITREARKLLDQYVSMREDLEEDESNRPVYWIGHDIGGTIVKMALILAATERRTYGKIALLTTTIVFLGCPHRANTISELEDQLCHLLSLSGPSMERGIVEKVKSLARQITAVNQGFSDSRLRFRGSIYNIISEQPKASKRNEKKSQSDGAPGDTPIVPGEKQVLGDKEDSAPEMPGISNDDTEMKANVGEKPVSEKDKTEENNEPAESSTSEQLLPTVITPFARHTVLMGSPFETSNQRVLPIDHLDLVKGYGPGDEFNGDWIPAWESMMSISAMERLQIKDGFINLQTRLLSLAPPRRTTDLDFDPNAPRLPSIAWLYEHKAYHCFRTATGPRILHLHGRREGSVAKPSQQLYLDYGFEALATTNVLYFQFDKRDSRFNNIRSMLITFINDLVWRFDVGLEIMDLLYLLASDNSFSLDDLYIALDILREYLSVHKLTLFISCLDECNDEEREWFLQRLLRSHRSIDLPLRVIISTNFPDQALTEALPEWSTVDMEECPWREEEQLQRALQLAYLHEAEAIVMQRRPALKHFHPLIADLLSQCSESVHLGRMIITWLGFNNRGIPRVELEKIIRKFDPVTPQNVVHVFIDSQEPQRAAQARNIFHWIKNAREPLTANVLAQALDLMMSPKESCISDVDSEYLQHDFEQLLGGMVISIGRDLRFCDDSIYDLADLDSTNNPGAQSSEIHRQLAETCLRCLLSEDGWKMLSALCLDSYDGTIGETPIAPMNPMRSNFAEYAARFWADHYSLSGDQAPTELALAFFEYRKARNAWAEAYYVMSNPFTRMEKSYFSSLPYMAGLGLYDLVALQIGMDSSESTFNEDCWLAIMEAARTGNKDIALLLLSHAEMDETSLRDAIYWAAAYGKGGALDDLIGRTKDIENFEWPEYILCQAASSGLETVVTALAESGYDMNKTDGRHYWDPIHLVTICHQEGVAKMLLEYDVDLTLPNKLGNKPGNKPVFQAVRCGDPGIVKLFLNGHVDSDQTDALGRSLVNTAIDAARPSVLEELIKAGADIHSGEVEDPETLEELRIPIVHASERGYAECVRLLLDNEADACAESPSGSALYVAAQNGHVDICRMLLEKGADAKQWDESREKLLLRAISTGKKALVELLVERGAIVNFSDSNADDVFNTPLARACGISSQEIVELLLENGADVNLVGEGSENSESPLFVAARNRQVGIARLLIDKGADIRWRRHDGWEPLHVAFDSPDLIKLLLEKGADIDSVSNAGWTVLMLASRWKHLNSVKMLLAHDPKPNLEIQVNDPGELTHTSTALLLACEYGKRDCVRLLLEANANLAHETHDGQTALSLCLCQSDKESEEVFKTILEFKPNMAWEDSEGNTLLHKIETETPVLLVELLIEAKAPYDKPNKQGYTPLAVAVEEGNLNVARYLVSKDANVNATGPKFGSILSIAVSKELEYVKLLIEANANPSNVHFEFGQSILYTTLDYVDCGEFVRYLVDEAHVDVNSPGGRFGYPILRAADALMPAVASYLIRRKADVNATDELGRRAVHLAVFTDDLEMLKILVKAKADVYVSDKYGRTPVHFAAVRNNSTVLRYLVDNAPKDFSINHTDHDGWTPLMWACRGSPNQTTLETLITEHGADLWARSRDGQWSALKLANFHGWEDEDKELLTPPEDKRVRKDENGEKQTWNDADHKCRSVDEGSARCWGCFEVIRGVQWKCSDCDRDVSLCFKCCDDRSRMHNENHQFEKIDPENSTEGSSEVYESQNEESSEDDDDDDDDDDDEDEEEDTDEDKDEED